MPADRTDPEGRRSLVPEVAARSLWLAAAWTGLGAALASIVVSIAAVAVCWLPASGASGSAGSAIRAGVLTFLAALHGGVTVDGVPTAFVPLGMTVLAGLVAWRAGTGLADAADDLGEDDPARLLQAGGLQAVSFALACALAASRSTLGTSSVSPAAAAFAGLVLFMITGGIAYARESALRDEIADRVPTWTAPAARAGAAAAGIYLLAGAVLVAFSVVVHHAAVESLSSEVGGGLSSVPVLLLGVLAVPNAAVAGAGYLAGPGFAVGNGDLVALGSSPHGTLPAFPLLGALPSGPAAPLVWIFAVVTPILAGATVARLAGRADQWRDRWAAAGRGAAVAGLLGAVLAWQAGGAVGRGRLAAVGASPWQFGLVVLGGLAITASVVLGLRQGLESLSARRAADDAPMSMRSVLTAIKDTGRLEPDEHEEHEEHEEPDEYGDEVAGEDVAAEADPDGGKLAG